MNSYETQCQYAYIEYIINDCENSLQDKNCAMFAMNLLDGGCDKEIKSLDKETLRYHAYG